MYIDAFDVLRFVLRKFKSYRPVILNWRLLLCENNLLIYPYVFYS